MPTLSSAPTANRMDARAISTPAEFWRVSPDVYARRPEMARSAERGAYRALHGYLKDGPEGGAWSASFAEIERVLGFPLPPPARARPAWWANDGESDQSQAWIGAGWQVDEADVESERVALSRWVTLPKSKFGVDEWTVHDAALLRPDATFSREEIYGFRV